MSTFSLLCMLPVILFVPLDALAGSASRNIVPQCREVTLTAAYLAEEKPGDGTGFLLRIDNHRREPVAIADPTPLGVHWYALTGGRWLWRASSGSGGSLLNAFSPHGPVFAYRSPVAEGASPGTSGGVSIGEHVIAAGGSYTWTVFTRADSALRYRPGCEHCTYAGEETFQAVLSYAYLQPVRSPRSVPLLACGLRSAPVTMPPLAGASGSRNSTRR